MEWERRARAAATPVFSSKFLFSLWSSFFTSPFPSLLPNNLKGIQPYGEARGQAGMRAEKSELSRTKKRRDKNVAKRILKAYGCTFLESEVILYFTEMQTQQL